MLRGLGRWRAYWLPAIRQHEGALRRALHRLIDKALIAIGDGGRCRR